MTAKRDYPLGNGKKCRNKAFKEVYYQSKDKEIHWAFLCRKHFKQENAVAKKHPKQTWFYCSAKKSRHPMPLQGDVKRMPKSWLKPGKCYSLDEVIGKSKLSASDAAKLAEKIKRGIAKRHDRQRTRKTHVNATKQKFV